MACAGAVRPVAEPRSCTCSPSSGGFSWLSLSAWTSTGPRSPSTPWTSSPARSRPATSSRRPGPGSGVACAGGTASRSPPRSRRPRAGASWWRSSVEADLAEPAETSARRGQKRRAKTDRRDARHLRELLVEGRLPEAYIPPAHLLDLRARVRWRKTLVDQRTEWLQRIHAVLFHHGLRIPAGRLSGRAAAEALAQLDLPESAQGQITIALELVEHVNGQLAPLDAELRSFARRQPGCRALMATTASALGRAPPSSPSSAMSVASPRPARLCASPASMSPGTSPTASAGPATCRARARPSCGGRPSRRASTEIRPGTRAHLVG